MADYTVKNLRTEVEDMARKFGLAPEVEARFARDPLECEKMALSYQRLAPNRASRSATATRSRGGLRRPRGRRPREARRGGARPRGVGRSADRRAEVVRRFEAGPEGMTFVAFGAPRTDPNDAEMIQGWWSEDR
jgi:hypothetical protein